MEATDVEIMAARARLREKFGDSLRVGGKGGARLKKRPVAHKSAASDDKKLQTAIRRMGLSNLMGVDELAMMKDDGKALVFNRPNVQVALNANTFVVHGSCEEKRVDQLSAPELDPEMLKKFAVEWKRLQERNAAAATNEEKDEDEDDEDDDDVPDLVEDFEAAAAAAKAH